MLTRGRHVSSDINFASFWRSELDKLIEGKTEVHLGDSNGCSMVIWPGLHGLLN